MSSESEREHNKIKHQNEIYPKQRLKILSNVNNKDCILCKLKPDIVTYSKYITTRYSNQLQLIWNEVIKDDSMKIYGSHFIWNNEEECCTDNEEE